MTTTTNEKAADPPRRAIVIDDHPFFQKSFVSLLKTLAPSLELASASSLREARALLKQESLGPNDLIFLDVALDDSQGLEALRDIQSIAPDVAVVIVTSKHELQRMRDACEMGARGYIPKRLELDKWTSAIESVLKAGFWFPPEIARPAAKGKNWPRRQRQIVAEISAGRSNRQIGARLGMAETTVKWHISEMLERFETTSRVGLVEKARRAGVID